MAGEGPRGPAAVLEVDPVRDADEFNAMPRVGAESVAGWAVLLEWLRATQEPGFLRIALRLENLGIADWDLWAWGGEDVHDIVNERTDATVVDLGPSVLPRCIPASSHSATTSR